MVVVLVGLGLTLRLGLVLRRRRLSGGRRQSEWVDQHVRWGVPTALLLIAGFLGGSASAVWLRDWSPIGTLHGVLGVGVAGLFVAVAWLGWWLKQGRSRAVALHGGLALLGVGLAALTALAGFVLLP